MERGGAQSELGPALPSRFAVYAQAAELSALARLAVEFSTIGPGIDLPRAVRQFARMREILGAGADG